MPLAESGRVLEYGPFEVAVDVCRKRGRLLQEGNPVGVARLEVLPLRAHVGDHLHIGYAKFVAQPCGPLGEHGPSICERLARKNDNARGDGADLIEQVVRAAELGPVLRMAKDLKGEVRVLRVVGRTPGRGVEDATIEEVVVGSRERGLDRGRAGPVPADM
jgi:hypothetical protein